MIIKSLSRKSPSFGQLIAYFDKNQTKFEANYFTRNLFSKPQDPKQIEQEFTHNFQYLPQRENGNALYHEIIVLDQNTGVNTKREDQVLLHLADQYCQQRAPNNMVYGRIHGDKTHRHIHLMISSNPVKSPRRSRLTKVEFSQIQQNIEQDLIQQFPELSITPIYTQEPQRDKQKCSHREQALIQRTKTPSKKQQLATQLLDMFEHCYSHDDLEQHLNALGWQLYCRGRQYGVEPLSQGRKYRFKTLGLEGSFSDLQKRFSRAKKLQPTYSKEAITRSSLQADSTRGSNKTRQQMLEKTRDDQARFADQHLNEFDGR